MPTLNAWETMAAITEGVSYGGTVEYDGKDFIYALRGGTLTDFYRYSISGNSWSSMEPITGGVTSGGALIFTGGNFIYALRGGTLTDFYRYYEDDSTNYLKEYDLTAILSISKIYSFSWIDRHITLTGKLSSKADMEYLETKTRKLRGGAVTILVPGGEEEYQDLTTDNANIFWLKFSTTDHLKSNLRNGYYLISSCEFEPIRGTIDQFQVTLTGFWITSIPGIIGSDV